METCPKCRSDDVSGPRYAHGRYGGDWLEYICRRCGYVRQARCADHVEHPWSQKAVDMFQRAAKRDVN